MNVKLKIISSLLVSFYTIGCSIDASILNLNRLVGGGGTDESVITVPDSPFYQGDAWNGKVSALSETTESVSYYRPLLVNLGDGS